MKNNIQHISGIMPVLGFGTWEITGKACTDSVESALNLGYRHIDTAQVYGNEEEVDKGIAGREPFQTPDRLC